MEVLKNIPVFFLLSTVCIPDPRAPPTPFLQFMQEEWGVSLFGKVEALKAPAARGSSCLPSASGASLLGRQRGFQKATRHQETSKKTFLL